MTSPDPEGRTSGEGNTRHLATALADIATSISTLRTSISTSLGISEPHWRLMALLATEPRVTHREAAIRTGLTTGGMTAIVDRLEERGFVERRPDVYDRRLKLLQLTASGEDACRWGFATFDAAIDRTLTQAEVDTGMLGIFLTTLHAHLDELVLPPRVSGAGAGQRDGVSGGSAD